MSREKLLINDSKSNNGEVMRNKQISEIAKILTEYEDCGDCKNCNYHDVCGEKRQAINLYNAGYRKQSEGEWIQDAESNFVHRYHCSVCNFYLIGEPTKYCEDCGAKMKGESDD